MKQIEITIAPGGQTRVETKGIAGGECRQASQFLEQALGRRTSETLTAEFNLQAGTDQVQRQQL